MGKYLAMLITFGILYYMLIMAVAPQIPTASPFTDLTDEKIGDLKLGETPKTADTIRKGEIPTTKANIQKVEGFDISKVNAYFPCSGKDIGKFTTKAPAEVIEKTNAEPMEVVTSYESGYANLSYGGIGFSVPLKDIKGSREMRIGDRFHKKNYAIFNPTINASVIKNAYARRLKSIEGLSEEEIEKVAGGISAVVGGKTTEIVGKEVVGIAAAKTTHIIIDSSIAWVEKALGDWGGYKILKSIKWAISYDFGMSELLGINKPFKLGQMVAYIWSIAVGIEIFKILPSGGVAGTVVKYAIGIGWLVWIGI